MVTLKRRIRPMQGKQAIFEDGQYTNLPLVLTAEIGALTY